MKAKKTLENTVTFLELQNNKMRADIEELNKKLEQCNYITQDTFLKNSVDLMNRLDALEKENIKKCSSISCGNIIRKDVDICAKCFFNKYPHCLEELNMFGLFACKCIPGYECVGHYAKRLTHEKKELHKPKIGEIWKSRHGKYYLLVDKKSLGSGWVKVIEIKKYLFSTKLHVDKGHIQYAHLVEKIC